MIDAVFAVIENEEERRELEDFYSENKSRLFRIALSKLHNASDAEDAVQEVFAEIAERPEIFFDIPFAKRFSYIAVMVKNVAVNMFNSKGKAKNEQWDDEDENSGGVSLEDAIFDKIAEDEVVMFINELPPAQRSVLMLHCFFELSIDETADRLNISITAANKRLTLARRAVRKFIDEREGKL
ncbi:MAG: RNA polymerase sigma factor [Oscillospiraceae bacterium]|nr:RNA polymerase sigma factor [Oscillospiraceae bacterium]